MKRPTTKCPTAKRITILTLPTTPTTLTTPTISTGKAVSQIASAIVPQLSVSQHSVSLPTLPTLPILPTLQTISTGKAVSQVGYDRFTANFACLTLPLTTHHLPRQVPLGYPLNFPFL